jgi:PKD repeat protein
MKSRYLYLMLFLSAQQLYAQLPVASFNLPGQACKGETVQVINTSQNALRYEWDLCQGDLQLTPSGKSVVTVPGNVTAGADLVFDGTNWFSFVTSRETNSIMRLDFGSNLNAIPTVTDLGNIGGINPWRPIDIQIIHDNGEWFGFVYGESANLITRIDFGNTLTNTTGLTAEVILTGNGNANCGLSIWKDGGNYILAYSNTYAFGMAVLTHVRAVPSAFEKMHTGNIPDILNFGDIKLIKHGADWFAYLPAYGSQKLFLAKFGTNPLSAPVLSDISNGFIGSNSPFGIDIGMDNGQYVAILCTIDGALMRINLGSDPNLPPLSGVILGNLSVLGNTLKISLKKYLSSWKAVTISWNSGDLFTIEFPGPVCPEYPNVLTETEPQLSFLAGGVKHISLRAFSGNTFTDAHQNITISNQSAPAIQISLDGICKQSISQFRIMSDQPITTSSWSFGDSFSSSDPNPTHQYSSSGDYMVSLQVTAENGCNNYTEKQIKIYDPPSASFTLPSGLICTNNEFTFTNQTADNFDGNLTYEWYVNDQLKSTSRDLKLAFSDTGDQSVKLKTIIPGCADEVTQTLSNVQSGPTVGFNFAGQCQNELIAFTNQSAGDISSYQWDFGDGSVTDATHPSHPFDQPGTYPVTLNTTGTNGCVSSLAKPVTIYSQPQTDFSLELPPFSCSGTPSLFHDSTPAMSDSNIVSWLWSFGEGGTSDQKNPAYTYASAGDYLVSLTATTNFGCMNSVEKTITIHPSPRADFTFGPACASQATAFTNSSSSDTKSFQWTIQNASYAVKNPVHIFQSPGTYPVTLLATGNNNCVSRVTKPVLVPVPPAIDFTAWRTCATQPATFQEVNVGGPDPAVAWVWDFGSGVINYSNPASHVFATAANRTVTLTSTRQSGCKYSVARTVPIIQPPVAKFSVFLETGASPFVVDFTNQSALATTYLWKFGDKNNSTSEQYSPSFTFTELGNYLVQLTASNEVGCFDVFEKSIAVVIPKINVALTGLRLEKVFGSEQYRPVVTIENKSNVAVINPDIYLELSGKTTVSEKMEVVIRPNQTAAFAFNLRIDPASLHYACAGLKVWADENYFDDRECVNLRQEVSMIPPYPNPANQQLILEHIATGELAIDVVIYNAGGQAVLSKTYEPVKAGLNQIAVDVSQLQDGLYMVSFSGGGVRQSFRFSILR